MKLYKLILAFQIIVTSMFFASCKDDVDFDSHVIGNGEARVQATIEFKTLSKKLGSRSDGEAIKDINDVTVIIYEISKNDTTFYRMEKFSFSANDTTSQKPSDYPTGEATTEKPTASVNIKFSKPIPYGKYYMYAAANVNIPEETAKQGIEALKNIECKWELDNVSANSQMFGYFTNSVTNNNTAFEEPDPIVIINSPEVTLHSWVKRLASKVTVAFDGSGLHNRVFVYIHNVSIRQIPLSCKLGNPNTPDENGITPAYFDKSEPNTTQKLFYNSKGYTDESSDYDTSKYGSWLEIAKGSGTVGSDHNNSSPALFFYENMQGNYEDDKDKEKFNKAQDPNAVGENVGPDDPDYCDNVPCGTFIEVEGYYVSNIAPVSKGPIRYRFMLGQDIAYDYNAIRNHHYKVTLGFIGYANQPDWHIEYKITDPSINPPEVYVPYIYNTSVDFPITFKGNLVSVTADIIENNWAPYLDNPDGSEVANATYGTTDFKLRTLEFAWNRDVYLNDNPTSRADILDKNTTNEDMALYAATNASDPERYYLYGLHRTNYYHLDENDEEDPSKPYYVTPIWAGFLRLCQPEEFENEGTPIATVLLPNPMGNQTERYGDKDMINKFRKYYYGIGENGESGNVQTNSTDLSHREFDVTDLPDNQEVTRGSGRNAYTLSKSTDPKTHETLTSLTMKLWTQPKSMCANSGFSGNNPYEDFNRKAVIRFTAVFETSEGPITLKKDAVLYQSKRLTNPKGVWRSHNNPEDFSVTMMERDIDNLDSRGEFRAVESRGEWSASIVAGNNPKFISLVPEGQATGGGISVSGPTKSNITFKIKFDGEIEWEESRCAIIEIKYHGNNCTHDIFVRQGYHEPIRFEDGKGPYWSSYNLFKANGTYNAQTGNIPAILTHNPLALGAFFKRGNYGRAISVSNIENSGGGPGTSGMGPLESPDDEPFAITSWAQKDSVPPAGYNFKWTNISGSTTKDWHWSNNFKVKLSYDNKTIRTYRVPTVEEYSKLLDYDFGVGVLYGNGAKKPAETTKEAFGYLAPDNEDGTRDSEYGMRGFICYNSENARQIFFPIGTSGIGRRTIQLIQNNNYRGTLRYGALPTNLTGLKNSLRPIPFNLSNAPGSIYWTYTNTDGHTDDGYQIGWDMNYSDLNMSASGTNIISRTGSGGGGDALPIRLVCDDPSK